MNPAPEPDALRLLSFVQKNAPQLDAPKTVEPETHLVSFSLDDDVFALGVEQVREVVRVPAITRIPQAPEHVRGLQNLRGLVLPVLEIRTRLGLSPAELSASSRVLVVEGHGRLFGLLVDVVHRVTAVRMSKVSPPPPEIQSRLADYVVAVAELAGGLALVLDVNRLLLLPSWETK